MHQVVLHAPVEPGRAAGRLSIALARVCAHHELQPGAGLEEVQPVVWGLESMVHVRGS